MAIFCEYDPALNTKCVAGMMCIIYSNLFQFSGSNQSETKPQHQWSHNH